MVTAQQLLELEGVEADAFCSLQNFDNGVGAVFGGQLLGLALHAAARTAPPWPAHTLSGYFLKASRVDTPLELRVTRSGDGRRFATRHVVASQHGQAVFELLASFHEQEPGVAFVAPLAALHSRPEALPTLASYAAANAERFPAYLLPHYTHPSPFELRPVDPESFFFSGSQTRDFWLRVPTASGLASSLHQSLLAAASDYWLPSAAAKLPPPDACRPGFRLVSLNHSLWFHHPWHAEGWLLYRTETEWAGEGRALSRGRLYDATQRLVATAMQEFLLRLERA